MSLRTYVPAHLCPYALMSALLCPASFGLRPYVVDCMISSTKANDFQLINQCHNHGIRLRNNRNYCLPRVRTKLGQNMAIFSRTRIWNGINKQLKELSFRTFRKTFKINRFQSTILQPDIANNYTKWQHFAIPNLPNSFGGCQILTIRFILKCSVTTPCKSENSYPVTVFLFAFKRHCLCLNRIRLSISVIAVLLFCIKRQPFLRHSVIL